MTNTMKKLIEEAIDSLQSVKMRAEDFDKMIEEVSNDNAQISEGKENE